MAAMLQRSAEELNQCWSFAPWYPKLGHPACAAASGNAVLLFPLPGSKS
jgi:hypothetical protein